LTIFVAYIFGDLAFIWCFIKKWNLEMEQLSTRRRNFIFCRWGQNDWIASDTCHCAFV